MNLWVAQQFQSSLSATSSRDRQVPQRLGDQTGDRLTEGAQDLPLHEAEKQQEGKCGPKHGPPNGHHDEDPGSAPQFLTLIMDRAKSDTPAPNLDPRISAKQIVEKTSVDLEISFAEVTDSALYYCALQPTVTGNLHMQYKNLT
ncbi:hypothetical protein DPEC_G00063240 [Dallia pectoralis]|uniref:Uncharacterized protein n=1 Tax=Dallia pectoralis TaxID=75939 RepID=A0ACC2H7P5_DALPE|nr:hypothetical protein DPEC_G00063240 [Dallia pectoralis]